MCCERRGGRGMCLWICGMLVVALGREKEFWTLALWGSGAPGCANPLEGGWAGTEGSGKGGRGVECCSTGVFGVARGRGERGVRIQGKEQSVRHDCLQKDRRGPVKQIGNTKNIEF